MSVPTTSNRSIAQRVEVLGATMVRWSIVLLLLVFGALKWTKPEADAIAPFIAHSPVLQWMTAFSGQAASEIIGVIELTIATLIAVRRWAPRLAMIGGSLGVVMFLTTLSFIVTTPGIGDGAAFLLKDVVLLSASLWTAGESWAAATPSGKFATE